MTKTEFLALAEKWEQDTCFLSSCTDIIKHPAVAELVQAGDAILPWIFEDYKKGMSIRWDMLLQTITGSVPYARKDRGYVQKNQMSWLRWWEKNKVKYTQ